MGSTDGQTDDNNTPPVKRSRLVVTTDGMCSPNPGKMRIGVIVEADNGEILKLVSESAGWGTSNVSEYLAVARGLAECSQIGAKVVVVYTDSQLVERQLNGTYRVGNKALKRHHARIKDMEKRFSKVRYRWHSREADRGPQADALAKGGKAAAEVYEQLAPADGT